MLRLFNKRASTEPVADEMYRQIVARARQPGLYENFAVADTLDGRFEMLMAHVILLLRRLRALGAAELAQDVFDVMFADMDQALRELGVGDLSVARRIRPMAEAFYGRAAAYEAALAGDAAPGAFEAAVSRNVFPDGPPADATDRLAAYLRALEAVLSASSLDDLTAGRIPWPAAERER